MTRTRVLLADDHRAVCDSVASLLELDFDVVGIVPNGRDLLIEAERLQPDVVVTDIAMPELDGIEAATRLRASNSTAKVIFLTVHDGAQIVRAGLAAGALGYVVKSRLTTDLIPAIHEVLAGHRFISPSLHFLDADSTKEHSL